MGTAGRVVACGVPTGFGSASNAASIHRGDVVIVMGSGVIDFEH